MNDILAINLVNSIRRISKPTTTNNLLFGEVVSVEPLKIDIGNNIILTKRFLYLGQMCRPHKVTIPHSHLVNALESEKSKAINTTSIASGIPQSTPQTTGQYDVKTQEIKRNDDKGIDERTLKTQRKSGVDLGGASLSMRVDVTGSATPSGPVSKTIDLSTFTVDDSGHKHIIPEHTTQDVHFPDTDYEESVTMEIYPRLKKGDIVLLFAMNDNQMYYVAERVEKDED